MWGGAASSSCLLCPVLASSLQQYQPAILCFDKGLLSQCELLCAVLLRQWVWKKVCIQTNLHRVSKGGEGEATRGLL